MESTRREALTIAAATVTLPMLQAALGSMQQAAAQAAEGEGGAAKTGWAATKLKPDAVKENEFTAVAGNTGVVLVRTGKDISALSTKCTHKGCTIRPKAGVKTMTCGCHQAQFNLDGTVVKGQATEPLPRLAIRTNAEGIIEIDASQKPAADAKEYKITLP